jgi:uncharacterized small protein (DUF1192 family)
LGWCPIFPDPPHLVAEYAPARGGLPCPCHRADAGRDISDHARRDNGTLRVTIREAPARLGVSEAAIRKRIQRGSLGKEMGRDGRVHVYLDLSRDIPKLESQVHHDRLAEELVDELRDRVAFLERSLERRSVEAERYQKIVAGLTQTNNRLSTRVLKLEAPPPPPTPSRTSEGAAQNVAEATPDRRLAQGTEAPEGAQRPWRRRVFGR